MLNNIIDQSKNAAINIDSEYIPNTIDASKYLSVSRDNTYSWTTSNYGYNVSSAYDLFKSIITNDNLSVEVKKELYKNVNIIRDTTFWNRLSDCIASYIEKMSPSKNNDSVFENTYSYFITSSYVDSYNTISDLKFFTVDFVNEFFNVLNTKVISDAINTNIEYDENLKQALMPFLI